jgi:hypothetical protein
MLNNMARPFTIQFVNNTSFSAILILTAITREAT